MSKVKEFGFYRDGRYVSDVHNQLGHVASMFTKGVSADTPDRISGSALRALIADLRGGIDDPFTPYWLVKLPNGVTLECVAPDAEPKYKAPEKATKAPRATKAPVKATKAPDRQKARAAAADATDVVKSPSGGATKAPAKAKALVKKATPGQKARRAAKKAAPVKKATAAKKRPTAAKKATTKASGREVEPRFKASMTAKAS